MVYGRPMCSPATAIRPVSTSTGSCGRPTAPAAGAVNSGRSRSSPSRTRSTTWRETAAGLRPVSAATRPRATGPWSSTVRRTAAALTSRRASPVRGPPTGVTGAVSVVMLRLPRVRLLPLSPGRRSGSPRPRPRRPRRRRPSRPRRPRSPAPRPAPARPPAAARRAPAVGSAHRPRPPAGRRPG